MYGENNHKQRNVLCDSSILKEKKLAGDCTACKIVNETTTATEGALLLRQLRQRPENMLQISGLLPKKLSQIFQFPHSFIVFCPKKIIRTRRNLMNCVLEQAHTARSAEITRISHDKRRDLLIIQRQIPTLTYRRPGWFVYFGHASTSKFNLAKKIILHLDDSINQYPSVALFLKRFLLLSGNLGIGR